VGIPSAELPHVFEQFFRASNVDGVIAGTGLGLTGVRQVVERHGGSVSVESNLGQGTMVSIHLPLPSPMTGKDAAESDSEVIAVERVPATQ
jgi:signal transduction histidine kinase